MRRTIIAAAVVLAGSAGPGIAEDMTEEIQETEQPGSEIELDIGGGEAQIERKSGKPLFGGGGLDIGGGDDELVPLDDPDTPVAGDPIDEELPGEGPESLSGPDDEDPLPY
jgi:hypothetical protein